VSTSLIEAEVGGAPIAVEVEYHGTTGGAPATAVELGQVWFVVGRQDYSEVRIVRADRLAETIGLDLAEEFWMFQGEAFDSLPLAAVALPEVLDPASWRNRPRSGQTVMLDAELRALAAEFEAVLGREQIVLTIVRRPHPLPRLGQLRLYAQALTFMLEKILAPFGDSSTYQQYKEVDEEEGTPWSDDDYNAAFDMLRQLQQQLEENDAARGTGYQPSTM